MNSFDKDYFENGLNTGVSLYSNYRWIPELTIPMAFRIIEVLGIKPEETILDYGCAKGYLVYAFRLLYRNSFGVDISSYAIEESENKIRPYLRLIQKPEDLLSLSFGVKKFNYVIAKDVLEHIPKIELVDYLTTLRKITDNMFVVVPLGYGVKYYEPAYEFDKTHVIREDMWWWHKKFEKAGFIITYEGNKIRGIKDNWKCDNGNGFFKLI